MTRRPIPSTGDVARSLTRRHFLTQGAQAGASDTFEAATPQTARANRTRMRPAVGPDLFSPAFRAPGSRYE